MSICSFTRISLLMEAEEELNMEGQLGKSASDSFHQHITDATKDILSLGSDRGFMIARFGAWIRTAVRQNFSLRI